VFVSPRELSSPVESPEPPSGSPFSLLLFQYAAQHSRSVTPDHQELIGLAFFTGLEVAIYSSARLINFTNLRYYVV